MKTLTLKFVSLILLSVFSLVACTKDDSDLVFTETAETVDINSVSYSKIELEILDLVNKHRVDLGLTPLQSLTIISGVADGHTKYMIQVGQINHDNFDQRAQILMNDANAKSVAENVAYGYNSAETVVNGWLNSESHRAVIENPNFTHFGISTESNSEGRNFFTQIFIKK
ncbi:CAP domain-containing protein [Lutibacter sp.]